MDRIILTEFLDREGDLREMVNNLRALVNHVDTVATIPLTTKNMVLVREALNALEGLRAAMNT